MLKANVRDPATDAALDGKSTASEPEKRSGLVTEDHLLQQSTEMQKNAMTKSGDQTSAWIDDERSHSVRDEFTKYTGKDCVGSDIEKHTCRQINGRCLWISESFCQDICWGKRDTHGCAGVSYKNTYPTSTCHLKFHTCKEDEAKSSEYTFYALKPEYHSTSHYTSKFTTCPNRECGDCPNGNIESHSHNEYKCLKTCWDKRGSPWYCKGVSTNGNKCILKSHRSCTSRSTNGWRFYGIKP